MGLFGSKDKDEEDDLRSQLKAKPKPRLDLTELTKARLKVLAKETYRGYKTPETGPIYYWVWGYEGDKEHTDGPYYTVGEADKKLVDYDDGEVFELRNVTTKKEAKEGIERILKERKKEREEFLRGVQEKEERLKERGR